MQLVSCKFQEHAGICFKLNKIRLAVKLKAVPSCSDRSRGCKKAAAPVFWYSVRITDTCFLFNPKAILFSYRELIIEEDHRNRLENLNKKFFKKSVDKLIAG